MTIAEDALLHISHQQREGSRRIGHRLDVLDLYETVAIASGDLKASAETIFDGYRYQLPANPRARASAKAAAERVLRALKEYEDQIEMMEVVS